MEKVQLPNSTMEWSMGSKFNANKVVKEALLLVEDDPVTTSKTTAQHSFQSGYKPELDVTPK